MRKACKLCPQSAVCLSENDSPALDPPAFYPQQLSSREGKIVFRCVRLVPHKRYPGLLDTYEFRFCISEGRWNGNYQKTTMRIPQECRDERR